MVECIGKYNTISKSKCTINYNLNVNSVDIVDQYLSYYSMRKWYCISLIGLFNAFKIYNFCDDKNMKFKNFLLAAMKFGQNLKKNQWIQWWTLKKVSQTQQIRIDPLYRLSDNLKQYTWSNNSKKARRNSRQKSV